jgi:alpha-maltose-1-phosphate synthase
LKILMLTREYPPDVYGGAGVHIEYLTRELARHAAVEVRTFGRQDVDTGSPSVYEPFGLINLEAMACEVPVVASAVGGIPEVVVDGETGRLIPVELVEHAGVVEPRDPQGFARDLAQALNAPFADPGLRRTMGIKGRQRAEALFSWAAVARRTLMLYQTLVDSRER